MLGPTFKFYVSAEIIKCERQMAMMNKVPPGYSSLDEYIEVESDAESPTNDSNVETSNITEIFSHS
jgi:hypothetical protein